MNWDLILTVGVVALGLVLAFLLPWFERNMEDEIDIDELLRDDYHSKPRFNKNNESKEEEEMKTIMGAGRYSNGRMSYMGVDGKGYSRMLNTYKSEKKEEEEVLVKPVEPVQPVIVDIPPFMKEWMAKKQEKQNPQPKKKTVLQKIVKHIIDEYI